MAKNRNDKLYFPKGRQIDDQAMADVRALLGAEPRERDLLIEHLHKLQDAHGHISSRHLAALAAEMRLSQAEVYEVATFYAHFDVLGDNEAPPPPLTVRVCDGIACELGGANDMLSALKAGLGDGVRVVPVPCVGGCDSAPMAVVGQNRIGEAGVETVSAAAQAARTEVEVPAATALDTYRAGGGYTVLAGCLDGTRDRNSVLDEIDAAGLRGLGGAGFPSARKWRFLDGTAKPRVVAVNADEGEPGTFKDRHCLETEPHRMIEGALIAAWAVEAEDVYVYLRDEYPHIHQILTRAFADVAAAGLAPHARLHLRRGAGAYICGEESAMLESIEGKRGLPRNRPPFPAQAGLFGRPTLINNVETLHWVPQILANGAQWYQDAGRPHFFSVSGRVRNPGVVEARAGATLNELIEACGGMAEGHVLKGFLPGGASGGILPADKADVPLDFGTLDEFGCFVGSAAVVVFSEGDDVRAVAANLIRFFEDESCGQCTPCRVGCEKMLALLEDGSGNAGLILELSDAMRDASICGLGQAAPNPVLSALRFFAGDLK